MGRRRVPHSETLTGERLILLPIRRSQHDEKLRSECDDEVCDNFQGGHAPSSARRHRAYGCV